MAVAEVGDEAEFASERFDVGSDGCQLGVPQLASLEPGDVGLSGAHCFRDFGLGKRLLFADLGEAVGTDPGFISSRISALRLSLICVSFASWMAAAWALVSFQLGMVDPLKSSTISGPALSFSSKVVKVFVEAVVRDRDVAVVPTVPRAILVPGDKKESVPLGIESEE